MNADETKYSKLMPGDRGNYDWPARFDLSGSGFLGISQFEGEALKERVLLCPAQVKALKAFLSKPKA